MKYFSYVRAGTPNYYLNMLDKIQNLVYRTVAPSLAASLEHFAHRRKVVSLGLFYKYYFAGCSSELAELFPFHHSYGKSTRYS